ncbi:mycofactocin-coupled SDR family oxidoreductase [Spirillospora sp. CA-255316]
MGMLEGKVALITGGARGQGRSHAITCAREGAEVIITDIAAQMSTVPYPMATCEDLEATVDAVKAHGKAPLAIAADVRDQVAMDDAVKRGLAEFGHIDILIANHGVLNRGPFWSLTDQQWEEVIGVNLTGVWKSAKAVAPHMIERQSGSIVITSSINGLQPGTDYAHYISSKHGVIGLMKAIALELAPHGIRCNAISPGTIKTPMVDNQGMWDLFAGGAGGTEADFVEAGYRFNPLKETTFMNPQVIADAALYLNSDLAAAVTGVTLPVDAGHLLLPGFNHEPVRQPGHS